MAKQVVIKDLKVEDYEFVDEDGNHLFSIKFYPTDFGLIERGNAFIDWFNKIEIPEGAGTEALLDLTKEFSEKLDEFLGVKESSDICDLMNPFTMQEDGRLYAEIAIESISKLIESELNARLKKVERRTSKYTEKYHK